MAIPQRSGQKVEAEQQFGAFPLGPLEALGNLHLSTGALRNTKPEFCPGLSVCICRQGSCIAWQTYIWWRAVKNLLQDDFRIFSHVYREANQVADQLANYATSSMCNESISLVEWDHSPPLGKGALSWLRF
ncbi:hypothetical protein Taro_041648 [Colocasia esculenta]|uniref:RNase H type-1 domain-containing protein n=1 Tax=Colocasia esculenta TaxID=4460 RepID=A0A843WGE6_COLES|nr:hypothetical protein [Colocasia esculenta]